MNLLLPIGPEGAEPSVAAGGQRWAVRAFAEGAPLPEYVAISYAWGRGRTPHPFAPDRLISDRALPALDTAARAVTDRALWLDALCVPPDDAGRAATLRRLACIYAQATEVLVVLSQAAGGVFEEIAQRRPVSLASLRRLEQEAWVSRCWTYQELARSRSLRLLAEGSPLAVDGSQFLNHVGEAFSRAGTADTRELPALENLLDVLAAWIHTGSEPFAYQVMAGLACRTAERPADRFNSVLGALDPTANFAGAEDPRAAASQFMALCEAKGDLSFIFTTGPRCQTRGRSWRPEPGDLLPVLAWHTFGTGQPGRVRAESVELGQFHVARPGKLSDTARAFVADLLSRVWRRAGGDSSAAAVAQELTSMAGRPMGEAIELTDGYFFPTRTQSPDPAGVVLVALGVRWVHGAPGLWVEALPSGRYRCLDVGIFVGPLAGREGTVVHLK